MNDPLGGSDRPSKFSPQQAMLLSARSPQEWSSPAAMALNVAGGDWVVPDNGEGWVEITEIGVLASQRPTAAVVGKNLARGRRGPL